METKNTTNLLLIGILAILVFSAFKINTFVNSTKNEKRKDTYVENSLDTKTTVHANSISVAAIDDDESYFVEKVCIDGYVYINMYQKMPVMTIQYGTQTALTKYAVLQSTIQSLVSNELSISEPEKCKNPKIATLEPDTRKDRVLPTTDMALDIKGKELYAKCAGCHGANGQTKALGKSNIIAGEKKLTLVTKLNAYKEGSLNKYGMGVLMKGQIISYSSEDINMVAEYISSL